MGVHANSDSVGLSLYKGSWKVHRLFSISRELIRTETDHGDLSIFSRKGRPTQLLELQAIFDSPPSYGKNFDWASYGIQDTTRLITS